MATKKQDAPVTADALTQRIKARLTANVKQQVEAAFAAALVESTRGSTRYNTLGSIRPNPTLVPYCDGMGAIAHYQLTTVVNVITASIVEARVKAELDDAVRSFIAKVEGMLP